MTAALEAIRAEHPPIESVADIWRDAVQEERKFASMRSGGEEDSRPKMRELKKQLAGEIVAFHDSLVVLPIDHTEVDGQSNKQYWKVDIPITLFPKRDHGFNRVECIVQFTAGEGSTGTFRIVKVEPAERTRLLASASIGGSLELNTNAKFGIDTAFEGNTAAADVAGSIYGKAGTSGLNYRAERDCVKTEIVGGTGARWRLDDPHSKPAVTIESHSLSVVIEVPNRNFQIDGAGYLEAHSSMNWVSATIGSILKKFTGMIKKFFEGGLPVEAYAEWTNVIPETE